MIKNRRILKTGLIFGLLGLVGSLMNFFSSLATGAIPFVNGHLVDIVVIVLTVVGAIYFFKKFVNNDILHLWQGIAVGFWTLVVVINFISLFHYLYLEYIDPSILDKYKAFMQEDLKLKADSLKKEGSYEDAVKKLAGFMIAKPVDVVIHQVVLKFLPFPITIFSIFFASLALRKVEK